MPGILPNFRVYCFGIYVCLFFRCQAFWKLFFVQGKNRKLVLWTSEECSQSKQTKFIKVIGLGYCTLKQWFMSVAFPPPSGPKDNTCIYNTTYRWFCSSSWLNVLGLMFNDLCHFHLAIPVFCFGCWLMLQDMCSNVYLLFQWKRRSLIPNKDYTFFWLLVKTFVRASLLKLEPMLSSPEGK